MTTENTSTAGGADDLDLLADAPAPKPGKTQETKVSGTPDKYAGKSIDDIINMHQNAEHLASRQGQELATLRRLTDEVIGLKKATTQTTEVRTPVTVDALLNDPEKAIREAVANSDVSKRLEAAEARNANLESKITEKDFHDKHKTFGSDINDPKFIEWVNKNELRQALAAETTKKNWVAAKNLWDMWDEFKEVTGEKTSDDSTPKAKAKQLTSTVKSSALDGVKGKPVYSRAKVMEFKMRVQQGDPSALAKWNDPTFQQNLNQAYADDRVR